MARTEGQIIAYHERQRARHQAVADNPNTPAWLAAANQRNADRNVRQAVEHIASLRTGQDLSGSQGAFRSNLAILANVPPAPHPQAGDQSVSPNVNGADGVVMPGDVPAAPAGAGGMGGLLIVGVVAVVLVLAFKGRK